MSGVVTLPYLPAQARAPGVEQPWQRHRGRQRGGAAGARSASLCTSCKPPAHEQRARPPGTPALPLRLLQRPHPHGAWVASATAAEERAAAGAEAPDCEGGGGEARVAAEDPLCGLLHMQACPAARPRPAPPPPFFRRAPCFPCAERRRVPPSAPVRPHARGCSLEQMTRAFARAPPPPRPQTRPPAHPAGPAARRLPAGAWRRAWRGRAAAGAGHSGRGGGRRRGRRRRGRPGPGGGRAGDRWRRRGRSGRWARRRAGTGRARGAAQAVPGRAAAGAGAARGRCGPAPAAAAGATALARHGGMHLGTRD